MKDEEVENQTDAFEKALAESEHQKYLLRLFIAGYTEKSTQAIENIRAVCENNLKGRYSLEVIDISQQPELARQEQILAAPTLIKSLPLPLRRVIGDLSNTERVLVSLHLKMVDNRDNQDQG